MKILDFIRFYKLSWCYKNLSNEEHTYIARIDKESQCFPYMNFNRDELDKLSIKVIY